MTSIPSRLGRGGHAAAPSATSPEAAVAAEAEAAPSRAWAWALGVAVTCAVVFRCRMLLVGRSLWLDETMLALNICGRSWAGLFRPLDLDQGAPVGFLLLEKLAVTCLGPTEVALRLVPFLASLATLALVWRFCAANVGRREAAIAVALAGVCPALIYYAGEVKQYGVDVAVGLLILNVAADAIRLGLTPRRFLALAACGSAAVWMSHTAIFVLAAAGLTLFAVEARARRVGGLAGLVGVGSLWLVNFAVVYWLTLRDLGQNRFLDGYWEAGFLPLVPTSPRDIRRYLGISFGLFRSLFLNIQVDLDLSSKMEVAIAVAWLAGIVALARDRARREVLALLVGPLALAILAAMLHRYPLRDRLALFTAAATLPAIAAGFAALLRTPDRVGRTAGFALLGCSLLLPGLQALQFLAERPRLHQARRVLAEMARDWQPGDVVVVDRRSAPPFDFYRKYGQIPGLDRVEPTRRPETDLTEPNALRREIHAQAGQPRVWVVLEAELDDPTDGQRQALQALLDDRGQALARHASRRYSANLYRFDRD